MKNKALFFSLFLLCAFASPAQQITISFTGRDAVNNERVLLSSVEICNLTMGWSFVADLTPNDTTVIFSHTNGIVDTEESTQGIGLRLSQNSPNPFDTYTEVSLTVGEKGDVTFDLTDAQGRVLQKQRFQNLMKGIHRFRLSVPAPGIYILSANQNGKKSSIKMVQTGNHAHCNIDYIGAAEYPVMGISPKEATRQVITDLPFEEGNLMRYRGIRIVNDQLQIQGEAIVRTLINSDQIVLPMQMRSRACPGITPLTDYDGNTYASVMIGTQCWMKDNLRTTHYADGTPIAAGSILSNTTGYFYHSDSLSDALYGYYYNWTAAMRNGASSNSNPSGVQGVCPDGWHMPSDAEWQMMEARIGIAPNDISLWGNRGNVAAKISRLESWLPSTTDYSPGNSNNNFYNMFGFSALPAGEYASTINNLYTNAGFWSATMSGNEAIQRSLYYDSASITRSLSPIEIGRNVRCVYNMPMDTAPAQYGFSSAQPMCTDSLDSFSFAAGTYAGSAPDLVNTGCLYYCPAPKWLVFKIVESGDLTLSISHSENRDIDFICWGPFNGYEAAEDLLHGITADDLNDHIMVDCIYSAASTEYCHIPNAQEGEFYVMLVTNYSRTPGTITITKVEGSGSISCD